MLKVDTVACCFFFETWVISKCAVLRNSAHHWMSLKSSVKWKNADCLSGYGWKLWVYWSCIITFCFFISPWPQSCGSYPFGLWWKSCFFSPLSVQWIGPTFIMQINLISAKNLGTENQRGVLWDGKMNWGGDGKRNRTKYIWNMPRILLGSNFNRLNFPPHSPFRAFWSAPSWFRLTPALA